MNQDTARRTTPDSTTSTAFLPCSDCRAPMRTHYFALDTRPVCPKCRAGYEKRIAYGRGPGSLARILLWGGGAALAGAIVLGLLGSFVGFLRVLCALAVAYPVAKAINKATGDYYMRRNQVIAVVLVWSAISFASLVPILIATARAKPEIQAPATPADSVESSDLNALDSLEAAEAEQRAATTGSTSTTMEQRKGAELRSAGVAKGVLLALVLFLTLPLVSAFGVAGPQAAAVALLGLGYALFKVWGWTSDGVSYRVTGPYRVGTGPIATTW